MNPFLICSGITIAVALSLPTGSAEASGSTFTEAQICKAGIGTLMGRDPKIVKVTKQDKGIVYLYYIRRDDGTKWSYRCKIEGGKVVWSSDTGRWRTDPLDEQITYRINGKLLEIIQSYSDGSSTKESFKASQIGT
jgi:hypothetical protein